jgi:hypothetical protein
MRCPRNGAISRAAGASSCSIQSSSPGRVALWAHVRKMLDFERRRPISSVQSQGVVIPMAVKRARAVLRAPIPARFWREWADQRASRPEGPFVSCPGGGVDSCGTAAPAVRTK